MPSTRGAICPDGRRVDPTSYYQLRGAWPAPATCQGRDADDDSCIPGVCNLVVGALSYVEGLIGPDELASDIMQNVYGCKLGERELRLVH
jgi:hypothetical protein